MNRILLFLTILLITGSASAQVIHVPADHSSIQDAIDASVNGDSIVIAEGEYVENIRFNGKAITIGSEYLLDGDTTHISRTAINGSESVNADTASVVLFNGDVDSTSILCGLTITGGTGTLHVNPVLGNVKAGGGIYIEPGSGGRIINNIIIRNQISEHMLIWGAGICVMLGSDEYPDLERSVIIESNRILNNSIKSYISEIPSGGGIKTGIANNLGYSKLIIQNNDISHNEVKNVHVGGNTFGGGMNYGMQMPTPPGEYIVRNNIFSYNSVIGNGKWDRGGGFVLIFLHTGTEYYEDMRPNPIIYNNIVHHNFSDNYAAGIMTRISLIADNTNFKARWKGVFMNNTVVDNHTTEADDHPVGFHNEYSAPVLFNNIFCNDLSGSDNFEIGNWGDFFNAYNNVVQGGLGLAELGNIDCCPDFEDELYNLALGDTCAINTGVDSIEINDTWFYAPRRDYFGNVRPYAHTDGDTLVDMGAIESEFTVGFQHKTLDTDQLLIYPVPSKNYIAVLTKTFDTYSLEIISLSGKKMHEADYAGEFQRVDISAFPPGIYFVTLRSDKVSYAQKIVKM